MSFPPRFPMSSLRRRLSSSGARASARDSIRATASVSGRAEAEAEAEAELRSDAAAGSERVVEGPASPVSVVPGGGAVLRVEADGAGGWRMAQPLSAEARATPATRGGSVAAASACRMLKTRDTCTPQHSIGGPSFSKFIA